jgi:hypothetical protein
MKQNVILHAFNRGIVSELALARVDMERLRLSAVQQNNWVPRSLGSMTLRPGLEYKVSSNGNAVAVPIPFIYSTTDTAWIDVTDLTIRPIVNETAVSRPSVSTVVTNGDFSSGTGWTVASTGGATGTIGSGVLSCECTPIDSYVTVTRSVTVAGGDQGVEHGLRIIVPRGPIFFRCGSTSGGEDYIAATKLGSGEHSLALTPTGGTFYVQFEAREPREVVVDSITIESAGELTIAAPWPESNFPILRWAQSGNILFVACSGYYTRKIERRSTRSWSLVRLEPEDGPFRSARASENIRMSIDVGRGSGTVTVSRPVFKSNHVNALFRMFTPGYNFSYSIAQEQAFTLAIRINGVGASRYPTYTVSGTWAGTLTIQKSFIDDVSGFTDVSTIAANASGVSIAETSDNVAVWFRIGFKEGDYTSGTAVVTLNYGAGGSGSSGGATVLAGTSGGATSPGGRTGVFLVRSVTSPTEAEVDVLSDFSSDISTLDWYEGEISGYRGFPTAVGFHEGRLILAMRDKLLGSISDAFEFFNPAQEGDSGPIQRSIGYGPVQIINFLLPLSRLIMGGEASEISVRSSSFDEPLTPTNFSMKDVSTYGSARIDAVKVDTSGLFVDQAKIRLLECAYDVNMQDYSTSDMNKITPDLNDGNPIVQIMVQRRPNTRVHCIREDGTVAVFLYEKKDNVAAWYTVETDGDVERGFVLPGAYEDDVYYLVKRTIDGSTVRYYEKFALESDCIGGALNKQLDCFYEYSGSSTQTISGLGHLEGETVYVWANSKSLGTYVVSSGSISGLTEAVTSAIVGLTYRARFKSTKLAYAASQGTAIEQRKRLNKLGLLLHKTHQQGIKFGRDFDNLLPLPNVIKGVPYASTTLHDSLDFDMMAFNGDWDTDSRLCLEANAPYPATVIGAVMAITTNDT